MAVRPVFTSTSEGPAFVRVDHQEFAWHAGMAKSRKQMSIRSLHEAINRTHPTARILEVSSSAEIPLGESLSAFNLSFSTRNQAREIAVECAFQGAKVFEQGGPYTDLMSARPIDAKRDPRLKNSGRLLGFRFSGQDWGLEPLTAFYDWVYINALHRRKDLAEAVMSYDTFTDIAFNPEKSVNCQAGAVALYVSLTRRDMLEQALASRREYLSIISGSDGSGGRTSTDRQAQLI